MRLSDARKNKGYTQEDVLLFIDMSYRNYQRIEAGSTVPSITLALTICELFDIDPRDVDEWKDRKWYTISKSKL